MNSDWFTVRVKDKNKKCVGDQVTIFFQRLKNIESTYVHNKALT